MNDPAPARPPVDRHDIESAYDRIRPHIRRTPAIELAVGDLGTRARVSLKLEFLQHAGSFKTRGAFNSLLSGPIPAAGVAAASGGNHGAAVAFAAQRLGIPARIFVPEIASPAKIDLIRRCGAEIVIGGARYDDAQAACDAYAAETGAMVIHPFAAASTMAGQGTVALEWDLDAPDLDTILIATGGGGLVSGMASWWAGDPARSRRVIAVEPEGSRALHAALAAGRPVDVGVESVAADSLGARNVGDLVFAATRRTVDRVALVPDEAITAAQRLMWRDFRLALEPGGATATAALLCGAYRPEPDERVGILLCGANLDALALAALSS